VSGSRPENDRERALRLLEQWSGEDFVWDGEDGDDRPLTEEELDIGLERARALDLARKIDEIVKGLA
jgi:hypothetical protein